MEDKSLQLPPSHPAVDIWWKLYWFSPLDELQVGSYPRDVVVLIHWYHASHGVIAAFLYVGPRRFYSETIGGYENLGTVGDTA
jgi:hypothetical protein